MNAPDLLLERAGAELAVCISCERSFAAWNVVDPLDGARFAVCELCLPMLGGCRGLPAA